MSNLKKMHEEMKKKYADMAMTYHSFLYSGDLDEIIEKDVELLIKELAEAEKTKDFTKADEKKRYIKRQGIGLEFTKNGIIWSRPGWDNKEEEFYVSNG